MLCTAPRRGFPIVPIALPAAASSGRFVRAPSYESRTVFTWVLACGTFSFCSYFIEDRMSAVVDQLIGSALASATTNDNPVAVAFVREGPYAPGCGGFYPLLRGAGAGGRKPIIG